MFFEVRLNTAILCSLTHWGRDEMDDILQTTFSNVFSSMKMFLIKISLKFVPKGPINNIPALIQIMAWHWPGIKPLPETVMVRLLMHICVTWPQWVTLWNVLWIEMCGSTLVNLTQYPSGLLSTSLSVAKNGNSTTHTHSEMIMIMMIIMIKKINELIKPWQYFTGLYIEMYNPILTTVTGGDISNPHDLISNSV